MEQLKSTVESGLKLNQAEFDRLIEAVSQLTSYEKEKLLAVTELLKTELSSRTTKGIAWEAITNFLTIGWDPAITGTINKILNPDGIRRQVLLERVAKLQEVLR